MAIFADTKKVITGENPFGFVFNNTRSQRLAISLTKNKIDLSFTIQLRAINWFVAVPGNTGICFAMQDGIAIGKTCSLYTIENFAGSS